MKSADNSFDKHRGGLSLAARFCGRLAVSFLRLLALVVPRAGITGLSRMQVVRVAGLVVGHDHQPFEAPSVIA